MTGAITEKGPEGQFCAKRKKVKKYWRELHIQELYGSDQSQNMIRTIKSRRLRKAGMINVRWRRIRQKRYDKRVMEEKKTKGMINV
jgi:hypothetical protein